MSAELKATEAAVAKMEAKLSGASFDPKEQQALVSEKAALEAKVSTPMKGWGVTRREFNFPPSFPLCKSL
jgi:hypothetical protein